MSTVITNLSQSTVDTGRAAGSEHSLRDVSTILSRYEPDLYPLDTLLRQVQMRKKATQTKIEWESIKTLNRKAKVEAEYTGPAANATTAAVITVDSAAPFAPDDILACVTTLNNGMYVDKTLPQLLVTATTATTVTVLSFSASTTGNAYIATPTIPKDTYLVWIGTAKKEGFAMGTAKHLVTDLEYNYCQIFEALVRVTLTRKATQNYTNIHDWELARQIQLAEFRRSLEYTLWFGVRSETNNATNDAGEKRWKMGGVTSYVTNTIDYDPATLSESIMMDWLRQVFMGNNGSSTRFLFADSYLTTAIQKTQLTNKRTMTNVTVAGINCTKINFSEGNLLVKHTRAFNEAGLQHYGVILDMKQLAKRELRPLKRNKILLWEQGTADAEAEQYVEQSSLEVLNPDCHAIIRGTETAAE